MCSPHSAKHCGEHEVHNKDEDSLFPCKVIHKVFWGPRKPPRKASQKTATFKAKSVGTNGHRCGDVGWESVDFLL